MSQGTLKVFGELEKKQLVPERSGCRRKEGLRPGEARRAWGCGEPRGDTSEETHPLGESRTCCCRHTQGSVAVQALVSFVRSEMPGRHRALFTPLGHSSSVLQLVSWLQQRAITNENDYLRGGSPGAHTPNAAHRTRLLAPTELLTGEGPLMAPPDPATEV